MYRDITIGDTNYRANLGILNDHRITIKDGVVSVSADLESRTPEAEFEATFTGRGNISIITAPKNADDIDASEERAEEYVIGDAVFEPGDDVKIAKAAKLFEIAAARYAEEMNGLDVGIFHLATDDRSKMLLSGAYNNARGNSEFTAKWKDSEGFFHPVNAETIIIAYDMLTGWIESLFGREAELAARVGAAETVGDVEAVTW